MSVSPDRARAAAIGLLPLTLTLAVCGHAAAAPVRCPPFLTVEQRATNVPEGFRAFEVEPKHPWTNAQLSDGPPDEQAWLAPDTTRQGHGLFTNVWTVAPVSAKIWLSCAYADTSVVVAVRLPEGLKTCGIRYDAGTSPPAATSIDCR